MQEEALERLREMQKRSRSMVAPTGTEHHNQSIGELSADNSIHKAENPQHDGHSANRRQQHPHNTPPAGQPPIGRNLLSPGFSVSDIFKSILGEAGKLDTDSLLILLMLFTLYKNKADIKLLVALGYILL